MVCGSQGSRRRLAKAAGAEPCGQMRWKVARPCTFPSQNVKNMRFSNQFFKLKCRKGARPCGAKRFCKWKNEKTSRKTPFKKMTCSTSAGRCGAKSSMQKTDGHGAPLDVQMLFRVAGATVCAPHQKTAKCEGSVAVSTTTNTTLYYIYNYNYSCEYKLYTKCLTFH